MKNYQITNNKYLVNRLRSIILISLVFVTLLTVFAPLSVLAVESTFTTSLTTTGLSTLPPPVPTNFLATAVSSSQIDLSWTASVANFYSIAGYRIFRDSIFLATTSSTVYSDTGLTQLTAYSYTIEAFDTIFQMSGQSATTSATTTATPAPTPVSGGGSGSSGTSIIISNIKIVPGIDQAEISFDTNVEAQTKVQWGFSKDFEIGSLQNLFYGKNHTQMINGLVGGLTYQVRITASDSRGRLAYKDLYFTTILPDTEYKQIPNPTDFLATAREKDIKLTWTNPSDPRFNDVRIVRAEGFYPIDQFDGIPLYEGDGESFVDTSAKPGVIYYYAIFARDRAMNYSSGALAQARIAIPGEVVVPPVVDPFANLPQAKEVDPMIQALTLADFEFIQDGKNLEVIGETVAIHGDKNLTIRLKYNKVPEILKTVAFTLQDPSDPSKAFPFLLRINSDKTYYEATIGALGRSGRYSMSVAILDYENNGLKRINGTLAALAFSAPFLNFAKDFDILGLLILLLFIILIILAIILLRRWVYYHPEFDHKPAYSTHTNSPSNNASATMRKFIASVIVITISALSIISFVGSVYASFNPEINYQGKLVSSTNSIVPDGNYNIRFKLYTSLSGGSPIWTETWCNTSDCAGTGTGNDIRIPIVNGLFSTMLGSTTAFTGVDFNQPLYLGVEIGGSGATAVWDGEMSPRKILGAVPAAFYAGTSSVALSANTLDGLDSAQFFRNDTQNATSSSSTFLNIIQTGAGKIAEFFGSATQSVLALLSNGNVGIGTSTPTSKLTLVGGNFTHTASGTPTLAGTYDTSSDATGIYVSGKYAYVADGGSGIQVIDISNPNSPILTGTYDTSDNAHEVYVSGKYAYVADGSSGLQIIDISNPISPTLAGTYNTSGLANGVYISGKYAFIADFWAGLQIVDISNPSSPTLTGTYDTNGLAFGVFVSGKYAYVADGGSGIQVIDISNPNSPILTGTYDTSDLVTGVYVSGKYAYISGGGSVLQIINISNPNSPTLTGTYDTSHSSLGIYVSGKYAYVGDGTSGLQIIDVSKPASPTLVGTYDTSGSSYGVYVSGKYAYVADSTSGLQIIDINGIETPSLYAGNINTNDLAVTENVDIGNSLYVRNSLNIGVGGMFTDGVLSVAGTSSSFISGNLGLGTTSPNWKLSVAGQGSFDDYVRAGYFIATSTTATSTFPNLSLTRMLFGSDYLTDITGTGLSISNGALSVTGASILGAANMLAGFDASGNLTSTSSPQVAYINATSTTATSTFAGGLSVAGSSGLNVLQNGNIGIGTSSPLSKLTLAGGNFTHTASGNPTLAGTYDTGGGVNNVYVSGKYAYTANGVAGLQIIDISNQANPILVGTYDTSITVNDVYVSGKYAYVADDNSSLQIIDISNPSNPTLTGTYNTSSNPTDVYISGKYAYVTDYSAGLHIIDISNPANPTLAGTYNTNGSAYGVYVSGKYAYVADDSSGLQIIDISNPRSPTLVGTYDTSNFATGVYVSGKYVYVADYFSGLNIIDISNPRSPTLVGTYDTSGSAIGVYISGKYAYIADNNSGLQIIDISNPASPILTGTYNTSGYAVGVYVSGKYAYVADSASGLQIIDINGIETPSLYAGNINTNALTVTENVDIGNSLYVRNGLNVGMGGIFTDGVLSAIGTSSSYIAGNLGLGTTSPFAKLSVAGTGYFDGNVGIGTTSSNSTFAVSTTSSSATLLNGLNVRAIASIDNSNTYGGYFYSKSGYQGTAVGVYGEADSLGDPDYVAGVYGKALGSGYGVYGEGYYGVVGKSNAIGGGALYGEQLNASGYGLYVIGGKNYIQNNLGLGTTSPNWKLSVAGIGSFDDYVRASYFTATSTTATSTFPNISLTRMLFGSDYLTDITGSGLTISNGALSVTGAAISGAANMLAGFDASGNLTSTSSPQVAYINATSTTATSTFAGGLSVAGSTGLNVLQNGNIGIGTSSPGSKLTLSGGNFTHTASGNPTLAGTYSESNSARTVRVSGKNAYVMDWVSGLHIVDISNPSNPTQTWVEGVNINAEGVFVSGKYAYVAGPNSGFNIIDISDQSNPIYLGGLSVGITPTDVYVSGKYAYLVDNNSYLYKVDISDPTNPTISGSFLADYPKRVYVSGKYAYLADAYLGLIILNISNSGDPIEVGRYFDSGYANEVYVSGKYAYVADGTSGLQIIDISNPTNPTLTGTYDTSGNANGVFVSGKYAYVADYNSGLQIIDISNPTSPTLVGTYDTSGNALGVYVSGKYAYVADGDSGIQIIDINGIETPSLYAGNINTNALTVTENVDIGNSLYVRNGLNVGTGGIFTDGVLSVTGTSSSYIAGNLGLGTTSPNWKLSVAGIGSFDDYVRASYFTATSATATSTFPNISLTRMLFGSDYLTDITGGGLSILNGALSVTGAVVSGAANMLAGFDASGNLTSTSSPQVAYITATSTTATSTFAGGLTAGGATGLYVLQNGRVGIGTISPSFDLSFGGNADRVIGLERNTTSNTIGKNLTIQAGGIFAGEYTDKNGGDLILSSGISAGTGVSVIEFKTSGGGSPEGGDNYPTTRMIVNGIGNIGIGTTTPAGKLDISALDAVTTLTTFSGARSLSLINTNTTNNNANGLIFRTVDTNGLLSTGASMMGVYTSHTANAVSGDLAFLTSSAGALSEKMRIMSSGNVGIGTTSPFAKLSVAGIGSFDDYVRASYFTATSTTATSTFPNLSLTRMLFGSDYLTDITGGGLSILNGALSVTGAVVSGAANMLAGFDASGNLTSTSSPQVAYITATSTTATSTFAGGLSVVGSTGLNVLQNGMVGIGTGAPQAFLNIVGQSAVDTDAIDVLRVVGGNGGVSGGGDFGKNGANIVLTAGNGSSGMQSGGSPGYIYLTPGAYGDPGLARGKVVVDGSVEATQLIQSGAPAIAGIGHFGVKGSSDNATGRAVFADQSNSSGYALYALGGKNYIQGNLGIGTTSPYAKLSVVGQIVGEYFTATSTTATSTFPNLSLTRLLFGSDYLTDITGGGLSIVSNALTVTGLSSSTLANTIAGFDASGNLVGSSTVSVAYGGTGLSTIPTYGQLLVGDGAGNYSLTGTSTLGILASSAIGIGTQGFIPYYAASEQALTATSSLFISQSSFIGIGTTTPTSALSVFSASGPQFQLAYDKDNYLNTSISSSGGVTMAVNGTAGGFSITNPQPASVLSGTGTNAPIGFAVTAGTGGNSLDTNIGVGGIGGGIQLTAGVGGTAIASTFSETGGAGGAVSITGGLGGSASSPAVDFMSRVAGIGGTLTLAGGAGGNASNGGLASSNIAGAGGAFILKGGAGGNATGATTNNGGAGGSMYLVGGAGGTGSSANGSAGNLYLGYDSSSVIGNVYFGNQGASYIGSTGNFGIGTTSPYAKLSVVGETVSTYFTATSTTATSTLPNLSLTRLLFGSDYLTDITGTGLSISNGALSVTGASILGAANMLAGFDASGNLTSTSSPQVAYINATSTTATSVFAGGLQAGGANGLYVLQNGRVGIGMSNPTTELNIKGDTLTDSPTLGAELTDATGWTATDWTGDYNAGFSHTTGNTTSLSRTMTVSNASYYQIAFTISGRTAGSVTVALGYATTTQTFSANQAHGVGHRPVITNGPLVFIPTTDFNGTISAISVKIISAVSNPIFVLHDSAGTAGVEFRQGTSSLLNTFMGSGAGSYNTTGNANTAQGNRSLYFNTTGIQNTAQGNRSLYSNTTGNSNTAQGMYSLYSNTTGQYNSAQGATALYSNTTGSNNSAQGMYSLYSNTTGQYNSAQGVQALYFNTTGQYNSAQGALALFINTTGSNNSAQGMYSLYSNTTGSNNVGQGYYALRYNQSATNTTAVGYQAARGTANYSNQGGVYLGYQAGYSAGTGSDYNTLLGYQSGYNVATGKYNIIIGQNVNATSSDSVGGLNIGNVLFGTGMYTGSSVSATPTTDGKIGIGTTSPNWKLSVAGIGSFDDYVRASYFTATSTTASTFPYASTTALTVSGTNGLQLATGLNGLLQAVNGLVQSSSTLSIAYGGTGLSTTPSYGQLLLGNASSGYTLTSTSSLGISLSSIIGNFGNSWELTNNIFSQSSLTPTTTQNIAISGIGTSTFAGGLEAWRQIASPHFHATSTTATSTFSGGLIAGGATGLYVLQNGYVGIGNTSPTNRFSVSSGFIDVNGTTGGYKIDNYLILQASSTSNSIMVGRSAGTSLLSDGIDNIAIGYLALGVATSSDKNIAIGSSALRFNTTGNQNVALGYLALTNNTTGYDNFGLGSNALQNNTTGIQNVAIGVETLQNSTSGQSNIGIGKNALRFNITGSNNIAIGILAGYYNLSATGTTAIGANAGRGTANYNAQGGTYLGYQAGYSAGTGGDYNTMLGYQSGYNVSTGKYNIIIGQNVNATSSDSVGGLNIGNVLFGTGMYTGSSVSATAIATGRIGVATTTPWRTLGVTGTVGFDGLTGATGAGSICLSSTKELVYNAGSDACLPSLRSTKHDINNLSTSSLSALNLLTPVSFIYNQGDNRTRYGFIAEDVSQIDTHLATYNDKGEISGIDDRALIALAIGSIKELDVRSNVIASSTVNLESSLTELRHNMTNLASSSNRTLAEAIVALDLKVQALATSTADLVASTTMALASNEDFISKIATTSANILKSDSSFIDSIATAVKNIIASAGEWVVDRFTARIAYVTRVEAETVAISKGMEIVDQSNGSIWCVTIKNGDWNKVLGSCANIATSTPSVTPSPEPTPTPSVTPITDLPTPTPTEIIDNNSTTTVTVINNTPTPTPTPTPIATSTTVVGSIDNVPTPTPSVTPVPDLPIPTPEATPVPVETVSPEPVSMPVTEPSSQPVSEPTSSETTE